MKKHLIFFFSASLVLAGCMTDTGYNYTTNTKPYTVNGKTYYPMASADNFTETGTASWYGPDFHGKKTSSGEIYNQYASTAAHKTLPFGTRVLVTNLENGRSTRVVINDRGPFKDGRIIDLSRAAAEDINMIGTGTARVRIKSVGTVANVTPGQDFVANKKQVNVAQPVVNAGAYYVQVGSFSSYENALNAANKLTKSGYGKRVQSRNGAYAVQAGPYSTRDSATKARDILRGTYTGAFVVE
ncbi:MAG: septal ring lytic transglycosylase RlpA family protein [Alphaproteobacteria bacterium]|nr:septal ring lytic transglycosylase RlpA family protein [Alphaproteobacteria bacterium]